ncbi:competence protein ComF [Caloranaerobacter sp. TR13]|uniref:late competence development ComFB family protein n=1 Tax=Caloranaerobacter sp. TR13 TaxID=1302151 RepID=UPI0006D4348C|nr:competence protein ComFB [Caloranaerobacter sp. TR13]KPU28075.1 competence protein ComF [Caloranaerobacter sp. TR13]
MKLYNYMEDVVIRMIDLTIEKYPNICKCKKCKLDMAAIALNNLPPRYIVTEKGKLFTKVNGMEVQFDVDVLKEVTKAIEKVSKKPKHDSDIW